MVANRPDPATGAELILNHPSIVNGLVPKIIPGLKVIELFSLIAILPPGYIGLKLGETVKLYGVVLIFVTVVSVKPSV